MAIVNAVSIHKVRPELDTRLKSSYKNRSGIVMMSEDFNKKDSTTTERDVGIERSTIELFIEQNRKMLELLQGQQVRKKLLLKKLQL